MNPSLKRLRSQFGAKRIDSKSQVTTLPNQGNADFKLALTHDTTTEPCGNTEGHVSDPCLNCQLELDGLTLPINEVLTLTNVGGTDALTLVKLHNRLNGKLEASNGFGLVMLNGIALATYTACEPQNAPIGNDLKLYKLRTFSSNGFNELGHADGFVAQYDTVVALFRVRKLDDICESYSEFEISCVFNPEVLNGIAGFGVIDDVAVSTYCNLDSDNANVGYRLPSNFCSTLNKGENLG